MRLSIGAAKLLAWTVGCAACIAACVVHALAVAQLHPLPEWTALLTLPPGLWAGRAVFRAMRGAVPACPAGCNAWVPPHAHHCRACGACLE